MRPVWSQIGVEVNDISGRIVLGKDLLSVNSIVITKLKVGRFQTQDRLINLIMKGIMKLAPYRFIEDLHIV